MTTTSSGFKLYVDYDEPPPHPGPAWTRFVCISDTHSKIFSVPFGDVLLHAGDLSSSANLKTTIEWLQTLNHPAKIIVAGNHDLCLDENWWPGGVYNKKGMFPTSMEVESARSVMQSLAVRQAGIQYLQHETFEFMTPAGRHWKVYGSPAAPRYAHGAFQYEDGQQAEAIYSRIPDDTGILLTHTPPYMVLDKTRKGKHAGCPHLSARLSQLRKCRLHVFGHIHEAHGAVFSPGSGDDEQCHRISANAAMASGGQPIIVDLK